jgi:signal transduction histidine kinase
VNGFAAVIAEEEEAGLSPGARAMFGRIVKASRNMGQMLTDLLEVLRVVRVELEPVPVDMHALALEVAESLSPQLRNARIDVGTLPPAMGDAVLLRQVLSNLLDNALKYSSQQVTPMVEVGHDAIRNAYFVRDNGMGFDMAYAGKLFGMFQRLGNDKDVPGLGVGLAIVARIIERHNGRVWAESVKGEGATFWFRIPSPAT